ncbi:hypothetical protein VTK26DRAFT_6529 [Humicola hyalothermophila]
MTSKMRSFGGCWTCRLRRKKCDETRPTCLGCAALEIECLYSDEKPQWMDGAEKQKKKAEWLKKEVKCRAAHRRERRHLHGLEVRLESLNASFSDDSDSIAPKKDLINTTVPSVAESSSPATPAHSTPSSSSEGSRTDSSQPAPIGTSDGTTAPGLNLQATLSQEQEAQTTMMYLDYVFPFVFPFYRPAFPDFGRGWLLALLTKNKALFHSALSLAGYFGGVIIGRDKDPSPQCKSHSSEALHTQHVLALEWLQREMQDIITRGVKDNLVEANRVMASIIQLMTAEVVISKPGNWVIHLGAATELFHEIMKHHAIDEAGRRCFILVLLRLGHKPSTWTPKKNPWGSDQSVLRFFTAQLLFFDTLASTSLARSPRLQDWHSTLLTKFDDTAGSLPATQKEHTTPHIDLEQFVGVQNWVIMAIGEIAALDSWKKEMKRNKSLSVTQLVSRATAIEQNLRSSLQAPQEPGEARGQSSADGPQTLLDYFSGSFASSRTMHSSVLNTQIWAQAALTYLLVVLSGWQPSSSEIRDSVAQTIDLLLSLPSRSCLRTLVWPFVVTGCLAAPDQEQIFRDMVTAMGPLDMFGTIREGLAILENVWSRRAEIEENPDLCDVAACLNCLGQPALLI